jgi:CAAX prenyl protease-like protein
MALWLSRAATARVVPYAAYVVLTALRSFWTDADSRWFDMVILAIVGALLAWNWRGYGELVRQTWPTAGEVALAVGVGVVLFAVSTQLDGLRIGAPREGFAPVDSDGAVDWPSIVVHALALSLPVPLMDELFWRSFLMRWLQHPQFEVVIPQRVGPKAIVLATFIYTLAHPYWLAAALAGLAYALLYARTGKLWTPVVAHVVANVALCVWVAATGRWALW